MKIKRSLQILAGLFFIGIFTATDDFVAQYALDSFPLPRVVQAQGLEPRIMVVGLRSDNTACPGDTILLVVSLQRGDLIYNWSIEEDGQVRQVERQGREGVSISYTAPALSGEVIVKVTITDASSRSIFAQRAISVVDCSTPTPTVTATPTATTTNTLAPTFTSTPASTQPPTAPERDSPAAGLVGHWTFDECGGRRVADSSEFNNRGALQREVEFTNDGLMDCALDFRSAEADVRIRHNAILEPITGTIAAWIRLAELPGLGERAIILGKTNQSTAAYLLSVNPDGSVEGQVNNVQAIAAGELITPERWHHIALTWDDSFMSVYVDGMEKSDPQPSTPAYTGTTDLILSPWYITTTDKFVGQLDEVRFYGRALSSEAIRTLYEMGTFKCTNVAETELARPECEALVELFNSTDGATTWYTATYWLEPGSSPCKWYGVTCQDKHVTVLNLPGNGLDGEIPPELGNLTELTILNLNSGSQKPVYYLRGSFPPTMGVLTKLQELDLGSNSISGDLSDLFGEFSELKLLRLAGNPVTGKVPRTLLRPDLTVLDLEDTRISDTIPTDLDQLVNLESFRLGSPDLTGEIPAILGQLPRLKHLVLISQQKLTGSLIPIFNNKNLVTLYIGGDGGLTGGIPSEIGQLTQLQDLRVFDDGLTESIPPTIGNLQNLQIFLIGGAQITGTIPNEIGNISTLTDLEISNTQIHGAIPSTLGHLTNLHTLRLTNNQLAGLIPSTFISSSFPNLITLDLSQNALNANDLNVLNFLQQQDPKWAQTQKYDLVGHWQFDECDGNTVNDASGLENHGKLQEGVAFTNDAVADCALQFSVTEGRVVITHTPSLEPITGTIVAWIRVNRLPTSDVAILGKTTDLHINRKIEGEGTVYDLRITTKGEVVGLVMNDDVEASGEWSFVSSQANSITPNMWHQIAFRWDDNTISIFVDGQGKPEWTKSYKPIQNVGLSYHGRLPLILGITYTLVSGKVRITIGQK